MEYDERSNITLLQPLSAERHQQVRGDPDGGQHADTDPGAPQAPVRQCGRPGPGLHRQQQPGVEPQPRPGVRAGPTVTQGQTLRLGCDAG